MNWRSLEECGVCADWTSRLAQGQGEQTEFREFCPGTRPELVEGDPVLVVIRFELDHCGNAKLPPKDSGDPTPH